MSFWDYIGTKVVLLSMAGIGGLYLILVSCLCGIPFSLMIIILLSGMLALLIFMIIGWKRSNQRIQRLKNRLEGLPEKYLIGEIMERPRDALELEYFLLMKEMSHSAIGAVEQARAEKQDYCDFVESWVHEVKTPLTYAKLRTAQNDTQISFVDLRAVCDQAIWEEMVPVFRPMN